MREVRITYYTATCSNGSSSLDLPNEEQESIEGVRKGIASHIEKSVSNGFFSPPEWLIVKVEWTKWFDDNGDFVKSIEKKEVVEKFNYFFYRQD